MRVWVAKLAMCETGRDDGSLIRVRLGGGLVWSGLVWPGLALVTLFWSGLVLYFLEAQQLVFSPTNVFP